MGTKIEYANAVCNPVKGKCPVGCSYCYARRFYDRKLNATFADSSIRFDLGAFKVLDKLPAGSRVFMGSTIDLFHKQTIQYLPAIMDQVNIHPDLTFIFLTKCPQNLPREWPDNCWVGVSTIGFDCRSGLEDIFLDIKAKIKFVSIEPLLDFTHMDFRWVNWVIIGQQTPVRKSTMPRIEWVQEILVAAHNANIPVFMKNNLQPILDNTDVPGWAGWQLRQELPREGR